MEPHLRPTLRTRTMLSAVTQDRPYRRWERRWNIPNADGAPQLDPDRHLDVTAKLNAIISKGFSEIV
jgi:hypothetical protein